MSQAGQDQHYTNLDVWSTLVSKNQLAAQTLNTGNLNVTGNIVMGVDSTLIVKDVFLLSNVFPNGIFTPSVTGTSPLDLNGEVEVIGSLDIEGTLEVTKEINFVQNVDVTNNSEVKGDLVTNGVLKSDNVSAAEVAPAKMAMFSAILTTNQLSVTGGTSVPAFTVPFDDVSERNDFGSAFNTATGEFTVPKEGLYLFIANVLLEVPVGHATVLGAGLGLAQLIIETSIPSARYVSHFVGDATFTAGAIVGQVGQLRLQLSRLIRVPLGSVVDLKVEVGPSTGLIDVSVLSSNTRWQGIYMSV